MGLLTLALYGLLAALAAAECWLWRRRRHRRAAIDRFMEWDDVPVKPSPPPRPRRPARKRATAKASRT